MATYVVTSPKVWFAQYKLDTDMIAYAADYGAEMQDNSVFGDTTRSRLGGMKTLALSLEGFANTSNSDVALFGAVGVQNKPITIGPITGAEDETGFCMQATVGEYSPGGALGEMFKFSASAENSDGQSGLVKGTILLNRTATESSSTTANQLGAVTATQKLYAALHVTAFTGSTLDVKVQSDDNSGMSSASDRITFTQATDVTSEWATPVAGAITDDYWRIDFTFSGTTFTAGVFVGIQ